MENNYPCWHSSASRDVFSRVMHFLVTTAKCTFEWFKQVFAIKSWNYFLYKILQWQSSGRENRVRQGGSPLLPWQQHLGSSSWDCLLSQSGTGPLDNLWHPARWMSLCGFEREQTPTHAWNKFFSKVAFKFSNQKLALVKISCRTTESESALNRQVCGRQTRNLTPVSLFYNKK